MSDYEFYTYENRLWYIKSNGITGLLSEKDTEIISDMFETIVEQYPKAYEALAEIYRKSGENIPYFRFLVVRRFCKCNFGKLDATEKDVTFTGKLRLEKVDCPLRGECKNEGIICCPMFNNKLSDAENRVMKLICQGLSNEEVAEKLFISPFTVKRHVMSAYTKVGVHRLSDFVRYANENNMFN